MSPDSEELAERIRDLIGHRPRVTEKRMFGGVCFLLDGNMVVGSMKDGSMLMRVGPDLHEQAKARSGMTPMIQGGKEMTGFILAADDNISDDASLEESIEFAWSFVATMPPKVDKVAPPAKASATKPPVARRRSASATK